VAFALERSGYLATDVDIWVPKCADLFSAATGIPGPNRRFPPHTMPSTLHQPESQLTVSSSSVGLACTLNVPDLGEGKGKAVNLRVLTLIRESSALFNFSIYFVAHLSLTVDLFLD